MLQFLISFAAVLFTVGVFGRVCPVIKSALREPLGEDYDA